MSNPKVSIIIPVYNGSVFLKNAIDCALGQSYDNLEIIVVNDGSTDNGETERVALEYGQKIRYFSKENGGVSTALNFGIEKMTGEYFSWLSHDDAYSSSKVKDSIETLRVSGQLGKQCVAFTGGYFIDTNGKKIGDFKTYFKEGRVYSGKEVVEIMTKKGTLNGCCMLIPKEAFDTVGGFHEGLRYSQDSLMWYQMFLAGFSMVYDNKPNVMYRLHRNQTSQIRRDLYEHDAKEIAIILAEALHKIDISGKTYYRYFKRLTRHQCINAIDYLREYADKNEVFSPAQRCGIRIAMISGFFRYNVAIKLKRIMIKLRR